MSDNIFIFSKDYRFLSKLKLKFRSISAITTVDEVELKRLASLNALLVFGNDPLLDFVLRLNDLVQFIFSDILTSDFSWAFTKKDDIEFVRNSYRFIGSSKEATYSSLVGVNGLCATEIEFKQTSYFTKSAGLIADVQEIDEIAEFMSFQKDKVVYSFADDPSNVPIVDVVNDDIGYFCFSNVDLQCSQPWVNVASTVSKDFVKICPHLLFPKQQISFWIENTKTIPQSFHQFSSLFNSSVLTLADSSRLSFISRMNGKKTEIFEYSLMTENGLKMTEFGFCTDILVRRHNEDACIDLMNAWRYCQFSESQDLNFHLALLKHGGLISVIEDSIFRLFVK